MAVKARGAVYCVFGPKDPYAQNTVSSFWERNGRARFTPLEGVGPSIGPPGGVTTKGQAL